MKATWSCFGVAVVSLAMALCLQGFSFGGETKKSSLTWRQDAVKYARILSRVKWTPVAGTMPNRRGGYFEEGTEYTGVPYSSVKAVGRCIGFDIYLKTFLAAVENPQSVLYTENLSGKVFNAAAYYGTVCSAFTGYALQCAHPYRSSHHGPESRNGVILVEPQSAQAAQPGDVIYTPPAKPGGGSHVELVTEVERTRDRVTAVRVEESAPPTTRNTLYSAANFDSRISTRNRRLYRITDLDAWRGQNRAESFLFPNYKEDSATPTINRVLLLDRGDWVPYFRDQPVKFNVMDKDSKGVKSLVIKRGKTVVEQIAVQNQGIIERSLPVCGDYTAHCVLSDSSLSRPCEFAVCDLGFSLPVESPMRGKPWEITFTASNLSLIVVHLMNPKPPYERHSIWLTEQDRRRGKVTVPANVLREAGLIQVWVVGENKYGRLTKEQEVVIAE